MRNRGKNLGYQEEKKIFLNLENREEKEKVFYKILKIERRKRNCSANLENREEKGKLFYKILKIERRKRSSIQKSCEPRGEREMFSQNLENREENET